MKIIHVLNPKSKYCLNYMYGSFEILHLFYAYPSSSLIQSNDQIDPLGLCTLYLFTICHAKTAVHGSHASHAFIILIILFEFMHENGSHAFPCCLKS